ncbi:MFS transporter [Streptomyces melanogenes]|uniref:MFS transporter n=1 Tax=Streptomyces melanogenes TaxID=67326 RepID=UPI00167D8012|nr:MFS transporter [Streptomyces melanogenes]GGP83968.1 MFS transporter [Streptomyces melanogenes]
MASTNRWGVLRHKDFRLLLAGRLTSQVGNSISIVALAFAVLDALDSPSALGLVLAAEGVSLAVCLLIGGVIADRLPRRTIMVGADLVRFASQGLLAALLIWGDIRLWHFLVLQVVSGAASALFIPAVGAVQPDVVPKEDLQAANALRGLVIAIAGIVGPSVGGLVLLVLDPGHALALDSLSFLLSALWVSRIKAGGTAGARGGSVLSSLAEGWGEFRSRRWLWTVTVQSAVVRMMGLAPVMVLGPTLYHGGDDAEAWGMVLSGIGLGALVGGALSMRLTVRRPLLVAVAGTFTFVPMIWLLAADAPAVAIALAGVLVGVEQSLYWTYWQTALHKNVPSEVLSRVSSFDWLGAYAFEPIGYALAGPVAALVGISTTLVAGGSVVALGTTAVLMVPEVRQLQLEKDPVENEAEKSASGA